MQYIKQINSSLFVIHFSLDNVVLNHRAIYSACAAEIVQVLEKEVF